jgi:hypothetical protein
VFARLLAVMAGCTAALTGCLFTTQTAAGRALHRAPDRLAEARGAAVTVSFASRLVRQGALTSVPRPDPGVSFSGVMDLTAGTASYTAKGASSPTIVFSGDRVFALTPHASPRAARPWIGVTLNDHLQDNRLDLSAMPASFAAYALRPSLLLDMLSGALTGSIHKRGREAVGGVSTTRYDVRFDIDQALDNATRESYSQRQIDDIDKLLEVLGIDTGQLDDGSVWLDSHGNPRRILVRLRESPVPQSLLLVTADVRFTPTSAPATVTVPDVNSVVTVPSLFQMLSPFKDALGSAS